MKKSYLSFYMLKWKTKECKESGKGLKIGLMQSGHSV